MTAECLNTGKDTALTREDQNFGKRKVALMIQQKEEQAASCQTSFKSRG
jgi:hypothetical protein